MLYTIQDDMPNRNKMILGTSSFWCLNMVYYFYLKKQYFQSFILLSITITSPIFWYSYEINSIAHKLDVYLSLIIFIYTIIRYQNYISFYDIVLLLHFYFLSLYLTIYKEYDFQLYAHLIYRCYYYKILYLTINDDGFDYRLYYDISKYALNSIFLISFTTNDNYNLVTYGLYSCQAIVVLFI